AHRILGKKAFANLDQACRVCTTGVVDFFVGLEFVLTGAPIGIRLFLIERSAALTFLIFFIFLILVLGRCCRDQAKTQQNECAYLKHGMPHYSSPSLNFRGPVDSDLGPFFNSITGRTSFRRSTAYRRL